VCHCRALFAFKRIIYLKKKMYAGKVFFCRSLLCSFIVVVVVVVFVVVIFFRGRPVESVGFVRSTLIICGIGNFQHG